jgi:hypothetical protein
MNENDIEEVHKFSNLGTRVTSNSLVQNDVKIHIYNINAACIQLFQIEKVMKVSMATKLNI